jgi:hypothetical protein
LIPIQIVSIVLLGYTQDFLEKQQNFDEALGKQAKITAVENR